MIRQGVWVYMQTQMWRCENFLLILMISTSQHHIIFFQDESESKCTVYDNYQTIFCSMYYCHETHISQVVKQQVHIHPTCLTEKRHRQQTPLQTESNYYHITKWLTACKSDLWVQLFENALVTSLPKYVLSIFCFGTSRWFTLKLLFLKSKS